MNIYLGIDFGTSGTRAIAIDAEKTIVALGRYSFTDAEANNQAAVWQKALFSVIEQIPRRIRRQIKAIAIDGTSATVLLCNAEGNPIDTPILYNDGRGVAVLETIKEIVPPHHVVLSATSSLAKLYWWSQQFIFAQAVYFLHQTDWLAYLLHGKLGISDYHNALKLGYDVEKLVYPKWLQNLPCADLLPQVLPPGTPVGEVKKEISNRFDLPPDCLVYTGTTDSIAAFLASGASKPGEAVTSLGSTLVLKLLSQTKIEDARYGIYSHRLGNLWLTGGASNTGGAVLKHFFSETELTSLSQQIDPNKESCLDYYPLLQKGDRFPINDPNLSPKLEPIPANRVEFLHGLLESIARIETLGYQRLQQFGANKLSKVYAAGGGAKNAVWHVIRQRHLQVPVVPSLNTEAAYGTALLASGKYR